MADYSLPGALSNLINDLKSHLSLFKGIAFRDLWDEHFLRLAHVEVPEEASGHLAFTPDVHQFGPLDTIWQLYMLFILTDPEIGVRRLLKDQSLVVRADAAVEFIRRWCEGDPPHSKEWDELMSFTEEESADETPLQPAEEAVISLILAGGGLIMETGSLITAAARVYHGAPLPAWALAPLKPGQSSSRDGLLSRVWSLLSRSKTNPHHIHCQARLVLNLAQLRWTPINSEEEAMLYRLLTGDFRELPEYEERLKKEYVEPEEIGQMSDTIRWIGRLARAAGIRRFAHVAGDEAPADTRTAAVPMAFRTWHAEGRAPIQISWLDTLIRDEQGLPQDLREQAQAWIGEKETREQAGDAWSKLRRWVRQHGYRETDTSLSRRVLQRPAAEGRTEFCVIEVNPGGKLYVRTGFVPASPNVDFWYEWESVARCQEWSLSSIDDAMGWYHTQITSRFKEGYVEVFPRPTWFSDPVDLKAICERQVPDPSLTSI